MTLEEDKDINDGMAVNAAIRASKRASRPKPVGFSDPGNSKPSSKAQKKRNSNSKVTSRAGGAFERDLGQKREGIRAKKGDAIGKKVKRKGKKTR